MLQIKFLHLQLTQTNPYLPVVTLLTQDNAKLLPQIKSGFKRTISWNKWNKYLSKPELLAQNANLNVEIKDYNVMIDGKNFFDLPIKNDKVT